MSGIENLSLTGFATRSDPKGFCFCLGWPLGRVLRRATLGRATLEEGPPRENKTGMSRSLIIVAPTFDREGATESVHAAAESVHAESVHAAAPPEVVSRARRGQPQPALPPRPFPGEHAAAAPPTSAAPPAGPKSLPSKRRSKFRSQSQLLLDGHFCSLPSTAPPRRNPPADAHQAPLHFPAPCGTRSHTHAPLIAMSWTAQMKVLLFSCLLGGACAFGANPELASEGAVAQGFGTPGAPSEGGGRETRLVKGGGCPDSAPICWWRCCCVCSLYGRTP